MAPRKIVSGMALGLHQLQFPQWVSLVSPRGTNFFSSCPESKDKELSIKERFDFNIMENL
jgi:hypothetical protein